MATAIKGISDETSEFLTCVLLHMLLPLLPLIIEAWVTSSGTSDSTLCITVAMYSIAIGLSSRNKAIFALCLIIGLLFSAAFGFVMNDPTRSLPLVQTASLATLLGVFSIHACERYNKHVVECEPFWNF